MQRLISFDIDGTMVFGQPPGHVTLDMIRKAKQLGYVIGSASDRTISSQTDLWKASNIEVDFVTLKHNLPQIKEKFAVPHYMHVGDTDLDRHFALAAGFDFMLITEVPKDGSDTWLLTTPLPRPVQKAQVVHAAQSSATPIVIVERPRLYFLGIEVEASVDDLPSMLPVAWKWLFDRQHELLNRYGETFIDVTLGGVGSYRRHLVGAEVTKIDSVPDGMTAIGIPSRKYMFRRYQGWQDGIAGCFAEMYDWARERQYMSEGLKLDVGYLPGRVETYHDLLVRIQV